MFGSKGYKEPLHKLHGTGGTGAAGGIWTERFTSGIGIRRMIENGLGFMGVFTCVWPAGTPLYIGMASAFNAACVRIGKRYVSQLSSISLIHLSNILLHS